MPALLAKGEMNNKVLKPNLYAGDFKIWTFLQLVRLMSYGLHEQQSTSENKYPKYSSVSSRDARSSATWTTIKSLSECLRKIVCYSECETVVCYSECRKIVCYSMGARKKKSSATRSRWTLQRTLEDERSNGVIMRAYCSTCSLSLHTLKMILK